MKSIITYSTLLLLFACHTGSNDKSDNDTVDPRIPKQPEYNEDSFKARLKNAKTSNIDLSAPITILSHNLKNGEATINFQNKGPKKVSVVVFTFRVLDAFGESSQEIRLNIDRIIPVGEKSNASVDIPMRNARQLIDLKVSKIAFADGTIWQ